MAQQTDDGLDGLDQEDGARLRRLEALYGHLEATVLDLEDRVGPSGAPGGAQAPQGAVEAAYPDLQSWVAEWFGPMFGRRLGATHWCATWWKHDEAVFRLMALWRSWEALRSDGAMGMASWIRDHLDSTRRELLGSDGPFQACDGEAQGEAAHNPPPPLATVPTPADWSATHEAPERSAP